MNDIEGLGEYGRMMVVGDTASGSVHKIRWKSKLNEGSCDYHNAFLGSARDGEILGQVFHAVGTTITAFAMHT